MSPADWVRWALPGVLWGTSFFFIAEALDGFPAATITPLRLMVGFLTLGAFPAARRAHIQRDDRWRIAVLGIIWMAIPLSLFPFAEQHVSSSVAGMLNGAIPLFATFIAALIARRWPHSSQVLGLVIGLGGVVLIALPGGGGENSWGGIGLIFIALVFYGISVNAAIPLQRRYGSLPVVWRAQVVAIVLTVPLGLTKVGDIDLAWKPVMALVGLSVLGTAVAYVVMGNNVGRLGSARAAACLYLIPVVSLLLGAVVRDENVAVLSMVGCGVALVGAWLAGRQTG